MFDTCWTNTVLCVGGSTTLGVRSTRAYPEHLAEALRAGGRPGALVANRGVAGARLLDVLRRLPADLQAVPRPAVLVVHVPLHDARGGGTPPSELAVLLGQVLAWGREHCGEVVVCTPTPVGSAPLAPARGFARPARRWVAKGAHVARTVAADHGVTLVDWSGMPRELLADVAHPGPRGHGWLAEQLAPAVLGALERVLG